MLKWLMEDDSHRELFFSAMPVLSAHEVLTDPEYLSRRSRVLNAVTRGRTRRVRRFFWMAVPAVAAAVGLVLLLGRPRQVAPIEPVRQMFSFANAADSPQMRTLDDGSTVYLMPGSRINYDVHPMGDGARRVVELEGEAYFSVARDTIHPFVVHAGGLGVEVLGTKFNVCCDPSAARTEVILEEGSVRLLNGDGTGLMRLRPNQMAVYDRKSDDLEVSEIYAEPELIVRYDMVSLNDATLSEVIQSIEKFYSVKLKVSGGAGKAPRYNVNLLKSSSIDNVLSIVEFLTGTKIERQKNTTNNTDN